MDEYFTSVRELEQRMATFEGAQAARACGRQHRQRVQQRGSDGREEASAERPH